ncbi:MAG TPA: hypothetical protein VI197_24195 [Polyangiaceae bacterium]
MQLGLLGPSLGHDQALERAAEFLHKERGVDRALYLGVDNCLDRIVSGWAEKLVGSDPGQSALWTRVTEQCLSGSPDQIESFIQRERERQRLKLFESLPGESTRAIELLNGKVAVLIYDKAYLDEEDILPATLLVFGKSREALVRRVGRRWFVSPGSFADAGVMIVDDHDNGIHVTHFDRQLKEQKRTHLSTSRGVRLRVSGG